MGCGVGGGPHPRCGCAVGAALGPRQPALWLRGGRGAGATATPTFDASLAELLEYLRSTSNNVSATAACTPAGHGGGGEGRGGEGNGVMASFVESELEEEEPNYNRYIPVCIYLFSPSVKVSFYYLTLTRHLLTLLRNDSLDEAPDVYGGGREGGGGGGAGANRAVDGNNSRPARPGANEDEDALIARPARTQDEWERQLDILYQRQLAEDRKNCDPTCDCEVSQWCRCLLLPKWGYFADISGLF
jgi:hypothetical protein